MKLYNFDGMFDKKLGEYITANAGKYSEEEWEDVIPRLYDKFGDTVINPPGKSPRAYFAAMGDEELVACLKAHIREDVPVPDFLCNEIEKRDIVPLLIPLLRGSEGELEYSINLIGSDKRAFPEYMRLLTRCDDEDIKNRCADFLKEQADCVADLALENYKNGVEREFMLEIMSRSKTRNEEIFQILIKEFRSDSENVPMHASYLAAYGDERALKYLLDKISENGINYVEYQELKFAIEALGGEYTQKRDFSNDPYYQMITNPANTENKE